MKEQLEKWKEMLKTGGKNRWAVFLLAGLLLLVISLPTGEEKSAPVLQTEAADEKSVSQAEELAERLEKVLSRVSGVGKTKVLVTLKSDGETSGGEGQHHPRRQQREQGPGGKYGL